MIIGGLSLIRHTISAYKMSNTQLIYIINIFNFTEIDDEDDWVTSDEAADDDNDRFVYIFFSREINFLFTFFLFSIIVIL